MIRVIARVESADAQSVVVHTPDWPAHRPGQFAMLSLDPHGLRLDPLLPRPMAVFRRKGASLEFRFHVVGRGTALLAQLSPGAEIGVDHHLRAINERLGLEGDQALPYNRDASDRRTVK